MYIKMEMVLFSVSNHSFCFLIKDSFKSNYKGKSKISKLIISHCMLNVEFSIYFVSCFLSINVFVAKIQFLVTSSCHLAY